jgi:hypothetical protein
LRRPFLHNCEVNANSEEVVKHRVVVTEGLYLLIELLGVVEVIAHGRRRLGLKVGGVAFAERR